MIFGALSAPKIIKLRQPCLQDLHASGENFIQQAIERSLDPFQPLVPDIALRAQIEPNHFLKAPRRGAFKK